MSNTKLFFFNQGDHYTPIFRPRPDRGLLNFFWFTNRFYSHVSMTMRDRYLHLFLVNPKEDGFEFLVMQGIKSFDDLWRWHLATQEKGRGDPAIIRSATIIKPDLILDLETEDSREAVAIFPEDKKGVRMTLFDAENRPIRFDEIPELVELLPNIKNAYPFIEPELEDGKYTYDGWGAEG